MNRILSRAGNLAVAAAVAMLATGCIVHVRIGPSGGPASSGPATYQEELAYAHCMRAHGLPNFPDPSPSGSSSLSWHLTGGPGSPAARANDACKHLLTGGRTGTGGATATASPPGAVSAIRQDAGRRDSGTGQLEAGS